ncbi:MAG: DUF3089 domain-containing protein [Schleiferiaceae bacterium]|nr:DUF3089 domain-containing protein [Schleiferiaceae bacterium]
MYSISRPLAISLLAATMVGCGLSQDLVFEVPPAPDYTELDNWAGHAEKLDITDSVFVPTPRTFGVPVFYVYPTVHFPKKGGSWNADSYAEEVRERTHFAVKMQSSAFNVAGPVYAPYYRQAAYQVYNVAPNTTTVNAYDLAYNDVRTAFEQFLVDIGPDVPFVLASHSQGTDHLERLIRNEFDKELQDRLVIAYLVGMPVLDDLPIPICEDPLQTGCFVSWRTFHKSVEPTSNGVMVGVVNPLSWNTSSLEVPAADNPGALVFESGEVLTGLIGAQIQDGIIIADRPKFRGSWLIRTKDYHRGDVNLYYMSIRGNLEARLDYLERAK